MLFTAIYYTVFVIVFMIPVGSARPYWFVVAYWLLILYFPNATYGMDFRVASASDSIYARGVGIFQLPIVNWTLIGLTALCAAGRYFKAVVPVKHNLWPYFWAFGVIFAGNIVYGLASDYNFWALLNEKGLFNLINMMMAFFILTSFVRDAQDVRNFINIFLVAAVTRGMYGTARFLFAGGDPANAYANYEKMDIKLTFFDINDGFVATLAVFIAGWRLMAMRHDRAFWPKAIYLGIVAMESFIVMFAYRRTGWIGFGLAAILFAMAFHGGTRRKLFGLYLAVGIPAILTLGVKRMVDSVRTGDANLLERLAPDIFLSRSSQGMPSRWLELWAAWDSISTSPIFGLGIMGQYNGHGISELAFHNGDFSWMHSGMLHIWLKSGFLGVALMLVMWMAFARFAWTHSKGLSSDARLIMLLGVAGVLFYLPTWMLGNPVIEYRTMQTFALALALPYVAYALSGRAAKRS
jgi:O-antigen ligase